MSPGVPTRTHKGSAADQVRSAVLTAGSGRFWGPRDFADLEVPFTAVDRALQRLKASGELVSVRRGLYYRGRQRPWGMSRPSSEEVIAVIAGSRGVGPAGLSAANDLGLTTQVPGTDLVAVVGSVPRDFPTVHFVDRRARLARRTASLQPREVAILEVLDAWADVLEVSPATAADRLAAMLLDGSVKPARLVAGSRDEPSASRERLRAVLTKAGLPDLAGKVARAATIGTRDHALAGLVASQ
jgi:hypothetical protein